MAPHEQLPPFPQPPVPVAVSECLTGAAVRYDGAHKRSSMPHEVLDPLFDYQPICPEVGIGLGVPRDIIRLVGRVDAPRAIEAPSGEDLTERLRAHVRDRLPRLDAVDGYIFKSDSPSCGLHRVKVFASDDRPAVAAGRGIFAAGVTAAKPDLPVEEAERLFDTRVAANFITRTFVHAHWRKLVEAGLSAARLIAFRRAYAGLLMARGAAPDWVPDRYLADSSIGPETARACIADLMQALARPATRGGYANALAHLAGEAGREIDRRTRRELAEAIEGYRRGEVPMEAPLALLRQHLDGTDAALTLRQFELGSHPPQGQAQPES